MCLEKHKKFFKRLLYKILFGDDGAAKLRLDAPVIEAEDTVITFEPVENANQYEVYANGKSIGIITP